jgi:hypothetical protein
MMKNLKRPRNKIPKKRRGRKISVAKERRKTKMANLNLKGLSCHKIKASASTEICKVCKIWLMR